MKKVLSLIFLLTIFIFTGCNDNSNETSNETNIESKDENETIVELETTTDTIEENQEEIKDETEIDTNLEEENTDSDDFAISDEKDRNVTAEISQNNTKLVLKYEAKGDRINYLEQYETVDLSSYNLENLEGEQAKSFVDRVQQLSMSYSKHDESTFNADVNTKEIKTEVEIDLSKDGTYEKLVQDNLLVNQNTNLNYMSLTEELRRLKSNGYEIKGAEDVLDKINQNNSNSNTNSTLLPKEKLNENHIGSAHLNSDNYDTLFYYFGEGNIVKQMIQNKIFSKDVFSQEEIEEIKQEFDKVQAPENLKNYFVMKKEEYDDRLVLNYNYLIENKEVLHKFIESNIINITNDIENPESINLDITLEGLQNKGFEVIKY